MLLQTVLQAKQILLLSPATHASWASTFQAFSGPGAQPCLSVESIDL